MREKISRGGRDKARGDSGQIKAAGLSEKRQDDESSVGAQGARVAREARGKLSQHGRQYLRTMGWGRHMGS